jgi:hypothetical protein
VLLSPLPRVPSSLLRHLLIVPVQIANKWGIKKKKKKSMMILKIDWGKEDFKTKMPIM